MKLILLREATDIRVVVKTPHEMTKQERTKFIQTVISGGQNAENYVRNMYPALHYIGLVYVGNEIEAVSCIKNMRNSYVFDMAGVSELANEYDYELGFSVTSRFSRGKGYNTLLNNALLRKIRGHKVFVTVRERNMASLKAHEKMGFERLGEPYPGALGDYSVILLGKKA